MYHKVEGTMELQLELEERMLVLGMDRYYKAQDKANASDTTYSQVLIYQNLLTFSDAIESFQKNTKRAKQNTQLLNFLHLFDSKELAFMVMKNCLNVQTGKQDTLTSISSKIISSCVAHLQYKKFQEDDRTKNYWRKVEAHNKQMSKDYMARKLMREVAKKLDAVVTLSGEPKDQIRIGQFLVSLLIETTGIVELDTHKSKGRYTQTVLRLTEKTEELIKTIHGHCEVANPLFYPTIIAPLKWTRPDVGGYYSSAATMQNTILRTRDKDVLKELCMTDLSSVYSALNSVQETPYRINVKVYEVMKALWEAGGGAAGLPSQDKTHLDVPVFETEDEYVNMRENHKEEWQNKLNERYRDHETFHNQLSKRLAVEQKISVARDFSQYERIYFPWSLDFRGRIYPIPSVGVQPQADDSGKALLEFADGIELGERGWYWLRVHTANTYGEDKLPMDSRVQWVMNNLEAIKLCAEAPLDVDFWMNADKPFSFLAACFEISAALKVSTTKYVSHLPIAQDGSNSGLQHFSAMLRDAEGGALVNLVPSDKPQDVYRVVADTCECLIADTLANDEDESHRRIAAVWHGNVDRKWAKRGTMTTPYGVSRFGLKEQLIDEIKKQDEALGAGELFIPHNDQFLAAKFLSDKLYIAIEEVVQGARQAMNFLTECATIFAKEEGRALRWAVPHTGLLVEQYYMNSEGVVVNTYWGKGRAKRIVTRVNTYDKKNGINKRKQVTGVAPNFVHSLDAAHLMMTVNKLASTKGIKHFAMIHDSFGTHAANTDALSAVLREQFVKLYQGDVLESFRDGLIALASDEVKQKLREIPKPVMGSLDLEQVKNSRYFFA